MMVADLVDLVGSHSLPAHASNSLSLSHPNSNCPDVTNGGYSSRGATVDVRVMEMAARALSIRNVSVSDGPSHNDDDSYPLLSHHLVDAIACVVAAYKFPPGNLSVAGLMLQTIGIQLKTAALRVRVSDNVTIRTTTTTTATTTTTSAAGDMVSDVDLVVSLLQLMEACIYMCPSESSAVLVDSEEVFESLLEIGATLGALPLDSFQQGCIPAQEVAWYRCWRFALSALRAWMVRLPAQECNMRVRATSILLSVPRAQKILSGPRRPNSFRPLSITDSSASATFMATVVSTELREMELIWSILAAVVHSSVETLSAMHNLLTPDVQMLMAFAFALLRKPGVLQLNFRQTRTSGGVTDSTAREMESLCASVLRDVCMTFLAWASIDTTFALANDYVLQLPIHAAWCRSVLLHQPEGTWEWNVFVPAPSPVLPLLTLETLRDCIVSEMSLIKKIHRDAMHVSITSASQTPSSVSLPPPTPQLGSSSPGLRHVGDGGESIAESEVSWFSSEADSLSLRAHLAAARAVMDLFVYIVSLRAMRASQGGGRWSGSHRDITEKMEGTLRGFLSDASKQKQQQNMNDTTLCINSELVPYFENAKKKIDIILKQVPK